MRAAMTTVLCPVLHKLRARLQSESLLARKGGARGHGRRGCV